MAGMRTKLRLLVNHRVRVFLLGCVILGLCQRDVFLALQNGRLAHELLKARCGKDGYASDGLVSNIVDRNPRIGGNEHGRAAVNHSRRVS